MPYHKHSHPNSDFRKSRWFTRGWTLQELIAPRDMVFFRHNWIRLGRRGDLCDTISEVTGIDKTTLNGGDVGAVSVAKKMSWASRRETTRQEDIAYCLIGIFGINMPLLYGEGERAFVRLQEEIMTNTDDQSLFAWQDCASEDDLTCNIKYLDLRPLRGPLARSPAEFANCGNVIPNRNWTTSSPYSMTNQGLRMQLPICPVDTTGLCLAVLGCNLENESLGPLGIYLRPVASIEGDQYARDHSERRPVTVLPEAVSRAIERIVYLRKDVLLPSIQETARKTWIPHSKAPSARARLSPFLSLPFRALECGTDDDPSSNPQRSYNPEKQLWKSNSRHDEIRPPEKPQRRANPLHVQNHR